MRVEHILLLYYCFVSCTRVKSDGKINYTCILALKMLSLSVWSEPHRIYYNNISYTAINIFITISCIYINILMSKCL